MYYKLKNEPGLWEAKFSGSWKLIKATGNYNEMSFETFSAMNDFLKTNVECSYDMKIKEGKYVRKNNRK